MDKEEGTPGWVVLIAMLFAVVLGVLAGIYFGNDLPNVYQLINQRH